MKIDFWNGGGTTGRGHCLPFPPTIQLSLANLNRFKTSIHWGRYVGEELESTALHNRYICHEKLFDYLIGLDWLNVITEIVLEGSQNDWVKLFCYWLMNNRMPIWSDVSVLTFDIVICRQNVLHKAIPHNLRPIDNLEKLQMTSISVRWRSRKKAEYAFL